YRRPHLLGHNAGKFRQSRLKPFDDPPKKTQPLIDRAGRIFGKGTPRRRYRTIDILRGAETDAGEFFLGRRIDDAQLPSDRRINPGAIDVEFELFLHDSSWIWCPDGIFMAEWG